MESSSAKILNSLIPDSERCASVAFFIRLAKDRWELSVRSGGFRGSIDRQLRAAAAAVADIVLISGASTGGVSGQYTWPLLQPLAMQYEQ